MGALKTRLELIAEACGGSYGHGTALALLVTGATLALARCNELGGYNMEANLKAVQSELDGVDRTEKPATAPTPPTDAPMVDPPF